MNFKPNLWKLATSFTLGFLFNFILIKNDVFANCAYGEIFENTYEGLCGPQNTSGIFWSLILSIIVIYLIWSFFQKKK